ncbi:Uma2 family endonuclease [Microvirga calopogonii]|uniref:Uma2 family endonuclease n=1 Tax=Microvirga calopogonii TaxID=2078013 RepID=UPI000E0CE1BF|nr:Uma2 family endonuclease [Microvirga calopogonii]
MTADEFFDWIERQSEPYELVDGIPVRTMAGARQSHNVATTNIVVALAPSATTKGCRTTSSDTAVRTGQYGVRYPDVIVDCGPPDPSAEEAARPTVVVEVSSPGTLAIDLTDRIDEYQAHDDIQVIMLVEPDVISVKVYRRDVHGLWTIEKYDDLEQSVDLPEVNSSIWLRDIYDTLEPKSRPKLQVVQEPESKPEP